MNIPRGSYSMKLTRTANDKIGETRVSLDPTVQRAAIGGGPRPVNQPVARTIREHTERLGAIERQRGKREKKRVKLKRTKRGGEIRDVAGRGWRGERAGGRAASKVGEKERTKDGGRTGKRETKDREAARARERAKESCTRNESESSSRCRRIFG